VKDGIEPLREGNNVTSPIRQNLFERECDMPLLEARHLCCDALQMALWRRKCPENIIVHTDRGGQYCSADYQVLLKRYNLRGSMSAKGCCYDNACAESFFHSLKVECIHRCT
jgi:putative transposase